LSPLGVLGNYNITYNTAAFTINPAPLSLTADYNVVTAAVDPFTKVYDGLVYSGGFTVRYSGFVNSETPAVLFGSLSFSGTATTAFLPGTYTVTPGGLTSSNYLISFVDGTLAITYGTCSGSPAVGILPPINSNGTSVWKLGSTVPVKFTVCDASGNPILDKTAVFGSNGTATITMINAARGTIDNVNEVPLVTVADTGFRFSDGQWIFNMATSNLQKNVTYTFKINLAYAPASFTFTFGVK
jgi:hypothetical protein